MLFNIETYVKGQKPVSVELEFKDLEAAKEEARDIIHESRDVNKVVLRRSKEIDPLQRTITISR